MFKRAFFIMVILGSFLFTGAAYAADGVSHTVRPGDTLWLLSLKYGVTFQEVIEANMVKNPDLILPGEIVWIPRAKSSQQQTSRGQGRPSADIELMARVVMAESRGEPYQGQVAVAAVLLNRLESGKFPNTIREIVFQPGAFEPVKNGSLWSSYPSQTAFDAVRDALNGSDPTGGALYFGTPSSWFIWGRQVTTQIGNHIFAK